MALASAMTTDGTQHQPAELKQLLPKLRPFQREAYEFATQGKVSPRLSGPQQKGQNEGRFDYDPERLGKGRILLCDEMGLGKTVTSLAIMAHYRREWPLLIFCPASLRHTWPGEIEKFIPSVPPSSIYVCSGFHDIAFKNRKDIQVVVVTYSLLQERSAVAKVLSDKEVRFSCVICDESHNLKQKNSQRSKLTLPILQRAKRLLLLSGTPALARPAELWLQLHALAPTLFGSWTHFTKRFCDPKRTFGHWDVTGLSNAEELHAKLKQVMVRRLKCDVLQELPAKQRMVVPIEITNKTLVKENKQILKELEETRLSVAELVGNDQRVASFEAKQLFNRAYQASGVGKAQAVADYLIEWVAGAGTQKVLVFAHHKAVMDVLELAVSKHLKGVGHIRIDGNVSSNERAKLVRKFQTSPEVRVGLLSMTAAGVGLTLTAASNVMFAELHYTPGILSQAEDRVHRIGQRNAVSIMYFVCKDEEISTDMVIWKMLGRKVGVLERVIDGGNGREKAALAATEVDGSDMVQRKSGQEELCNFFADAANVQNNKKGSSKTPDKGSILSFFKRGTEMNVQEISEEKLTRTMPATASTSQKGDNNDSVEWQCQMCTFINKKVFAKYLYCEMCHTPFDEDISDFENMEMIMAVTPHSTLQEKKGDSSFHRRGDMLPSVYNNGKSPTACPLAAAPSKRASPNIADVIVIKEDEVCSTRKVDPGKKRPLMNMVVIDGDEEKSPSTREAWQAMSSSFRKRETYNDPEMLTFSVSKHTSRITLHYRDAGLPSLVNFDIHDVVTQDTIDALTHANITDPNTQANPMHIAFCTDAINKLVERLNSEEIFCTKKRNQCCSEVQAFVSSFLALREVERKAIRDHGKPCSAKGLRQTAAKIMTGVLEQKKLNNLGSMDRYCGGAKERANENMKDLIATSTDLAVLRGDNCAWCAGVLSNESKAAKAVYCSLDCAEVGRLRRGGMYASFRIREQLFALEGGVCQKCHTDTHALFLQVKAMSSVAERRRALENAKCFVVPQSQHAFTRILNDLKEGLFWQADHIVPVAEGGGSCGLENLRTLCSRCHQEETEELRRRLKLTGGAKNSENTTSGTCEKRKQVDIRAAFAVGSAQDKKRSKR